MQVILNNTTKIVSINGVPARIWEGQTSNGIKVHAFITRIACDKDDDSSEFEKDLQEQSAPSEEVKCYPLSMIL